LVTVLPTAITSSTLLVCHVGTYTYRCAPISADSVSVVNCSLKKM
jgi:hypothetical protein